jgi:uncharacterized repeat protein (TIGR01451 family)
MGNGRRGRSAGFALGSVGVLLLAGLVLLGSVSRHYAQRASSAQPSASSMPGLTIPGLTIPGLTRASLDSNTQPSKPDARAILGQLPLIFEANQGQADAKVKFLARGAGYTLFLDSTDAVLALRGAPNSRSSIGEQFVSMKLVGANAAALTAGTDLLPGKSNYVIGNDPQRWHSGIPQYAGVRYASVYPGIDLVFYGSQGNLEYDFKVAPGADPAQAELQFDGASKVKLSGGDLLLTAEKTGSVRLQAPRIYQRDGDHRQSVAGHFILRAGNRVGFAIGSYDHSRELVIDPVLKFSTYFGGAGAVTSPSVSVNGNGFIYVTGSTTSASGFPLNGTPSTQIGPGADIFVAEINPSQPPSVVYMTFLGGSGTDTSVGIGVDNAGKAYVVGNTTSPDFPTSGTNVLGYQTVPAVKGTQCASITCTSVFVSVLPVSGAAPLSYSSYFSGNGNDQASAMTTDLSGDVFITGTTTSNDVPGISDAFPATFLPVPFQTQPVSTVQFFVTKVNTSIPSTGGVAYSTYFGGGTPVPPIATGGGIAVDSTGNIYFSGTTNFFNSGSGQFGDSGQSEDFPILNAYQPCLDTIPPTVLTNVNPCTAPATPYPTDAFVAKLNPNGAAGAQLLFSTYLGGTGTDGSTAIAVDSGAANIYITGSTDSIDFVLPTGIGAYQSCLNTPPPNVLPCPVVAGTDAYVARLTNPTLSTTGTPNNVGLTYFSYLGGSGTDSGLAVAVLNSLTATLGDVLVTGTTNSTNFPVTVGAIQSQLGAGAIQNAFFAQIDTTTTVGNNGVGSYVTYFGGNGLDRGTSLAVDPNQNSYLVGDTTSTNLQVVDSLPGAGGATLSGSTDAFVVKLGSATDLCITCVAPTLSSSIVSAGNTVSVTFTVSNEGPDPATNITVTGSISSGMVFNTATAGSGTCSAPTGATAVCTIPALQSGSTSSVVFTVTPSSNGNYSVTAQVSNTNNTNSVNSTTASFTAGAFSMGVSPPAQSVTAGVTTTYSVQMSPNPVFGAPVSLTCGSLPGGASCNFAPSSSITLNGPQSVTLNLATTPQPVNIARLGWRNPFYALWLMIPGMAVLGLGARGKRRGYMSRLLGVLMFCLFFALVLFQPACSSGKTPATVSGTPTGTYQLTVTATSGTFSKSAPFSLTVSP